ncbi:MAG: hypothetical protein KZQ76_00835 [Candidatus Thiodiazotropha sp. (ex Epidulcina cf. delphinae)]|nr:hypothetical protein [Candidatus Thiodiazotropha sp. (ex Epidulcina cf. delphinae)]
MASSEQIARYILSKRYFSVSNHTVKYGAYLPAPNGEASVYRISNLSEKEIWDIGQEYVAGPSKRTLRARGDTAAAVITASGLEIVLETAPHPLHANIVNWPSEKDKQKMLAVEIANEAKLVMQPA